VRVVEVKESGSIETTCWQHYCLNTSRESKRKEQTKMFCIHQLLWVTAFTLFHGDVSAFTTTTRTKRIRPAASSGLFGSAAKKAVAEGGLESLTASSPTKKKRVAVLVCPAQFCVPDDYECLFSLLSNEKVLSNDVELGTCVTAPLPRTEWIKVARQLPTAAFFQGQLPVEETLRWYFDAIETGLAEIFANESDDCTVCIIGHSIGGWVARAYLGGLSRSSTAVHRLALERVSSLVTLGTPHAAAAEKAAFVVDQTRGLLAAIDAAPSCTPSALQQDLGIEITCVCSSGLKGKILSSNVEEIIAATSYLPQMGKLDGNAAGDGIVPLELAFLDEPARRVVLDNCSISSAPIRHAHVVPTPWNLLDGYAPSIRLPKDSYPSYVTEGVVNQWAQYIR